MKISELSGSCGKKEVKMNLAVQRSTSNCAKFESKIILTNQYPANIWSRTNDLTHKIIVDLLEIQCIKDKLN